MKLITLAMTLLALNGGTEQGCNNQSVHRQILLQDERLTLGDDGVPQQSPNLHASITNVREVSTQEDQVVCEADIEVSGALHAFKEMYMSWGHPMEMVLASWAYEDKEYHHYIDTLMQTYYQPDSVPAEVFEKTFTAQTAISFVVSENDEGLEQLRTYSYTDKERFWLYQAATEVKPYYDVYYQAKRERAIEKLKAEIAQKDAEAKALGYYSDGHRRSEEAKKHAAQKEGDF